MSDLHLEKFEPLRERLMELGQVKYDGTIAFALRELTAFINNDLAQARLEEAKLCAAAEWDALVIKVDIDIVRGFFEKRIAELERAVGEGKK